MTLIALTVDARFFDVKFDAILHLNVVDNDSIVCLTRETMQERTKEDVVNDNKGEVIESLISHNRSDEKENPIKIFGIGKKRSSNQMSGL